MSNHNHAKSDHTWQFFRAGGFDQVRIDRGEDLCHLAELDQKLWLALSCPTRGLEYDAATLDLIDTDHDGRIRAEILEAVAWACARLKDNDELIRSGPVLPLASINSTTAEGVALLASAKQILANLGKPEATEISVAETGDTTKIFAQTSLNGDGVVPPEATKDPAVAAVITDIMSCMGSKADRSGKMGIDQPAADAFFTALQAYSDWYSVAEKDATIFPLGAGTENAAAALAAVKTKIQDFFVRCRVAAFDGRAVAALNRKEDEYAAMAAHDLTISSAEIAALPLARVEAAGQLPLKAGVNPAWADAMSAFELEVVRPIVGARDAITQDDWRKIFDTFTAYHAWQAAKAGGVVEKLGLPRVREILAGPAKGAITELIAQDRALEPQANAIAAVDRLARYHRDLYKLLVNFVNFQDFYSREHKAVFQAGTLYLDQRSCELCVRVEDAAKHATMAHLSYTYLAYCDLTRKATNETMTVAAAFTGGDSDNLMVGRNGIFYDRQGRDWDATIAKIIEHPISIRQAFWSPYKRFVRWVQDQIAKRAADADALAGQKLASAATAAEATAAARPPAAAAAAPVPPKKLDVGVVAALGVAVGALSSALGLILAWLSNTPFYFIPLYAALIVLAISLPSMILAALKLNQRNLGPILDANGWAINAKARVNIPFGASLTGVAKLPPGSHRDLVDRYGESHKGRNWFILLVILGAAVWGCWNYGVFYNYTPWLPWLGSNKSTWLENHEDKVKAEQGIKAAAATQAAATQAAADKAKRDAEASGKDYADAIKRMQPDTAAATGTGK